MNAPLVSMPQLLRELDDIKPTMQTLPPHFATGCDAHVRERYASLLATVLLGQGRISEPQSRLFRLLLASLELADAQARLFEQAPGTNQDILRDCAHLFEEHGLALSFLVDAAVLLRLAGSLPTEQQQLLCEFADLFRVQPADLALVADLAAIILGMEPTRDIPPQFNYAIFNTWSEFLYRPLTVERLLAGPLTGRWKVTAPMTLDRPWVMEGAWLRFEGEGRIRTELVSMSHVRITGCRFETPIMEFLGRLSLEINDSEIIGDYAESAKHTAITIATEKACSQYSERIDTAKLSNLTVQTRNARSFLIDGTKTSVENCRFNQCGNRYLIGGALAVFDSESASSWFGKFFLAPDFRISHSVFEECIARLGGGIRISEIKSSNNCAIHYCRFEKCSSTAYNDLDGAVCMEDVAFSGGAIFADAISPNSFSCVSKCSFVNSSVQIGRSMEGSRDARPVEGCSFKESFLAYVHSLDASPDTGCTYSNSAKDFNRAREVCKERQEWWNEFQVGVILKDGSDDFE